MHKEKVKIGYFNWDLKSKIDILVFFYSFNYYFLNLNNYS